MTDLNDKVRAVFVERYKTAPNVIKSPGRINLIGEHIDYNDGFVFPAAIDKAIYLALAPSEGSQSRWYAMDYEEEVSVSVDDLSPLDKVHWQNYIAGVAAEYLKAGREVPNFDVVFTGDIPQGAGLSSSVALENAVAFGLNSIFDFGMERKAMALLSQQAEWNFAGVQCGIMDQFASMMGAKNHALLLDCNSLDHESIPIDVVPYSFVLVNTNVKHQLSDSPYNQRVQQCKEGLEALKNIDSNIETFRDVNEHHLQALEATVSEVVFRRIFFCGGRNKKGFGRKKRYTIERLDCTGIIDVRDA